MKHNSHIYIAAKATEFLREAVHNLQTLAGQPSRADTRRIGDKAKWLQRLMQRHQADIIEASWAPDDILNDKSRFHTFKLYTPDVLPERALRPARRSSEPEGHEQTGTGRSLLPKIAARAG